MNDAMGQQVELTEKEELAYKLVETLKIATQSLLPSYEDIKAISTLIESLAAKEEAGEVEEGK